MWKYYALLSALFAALTAVFATIGVKDINSDLATAIRTSVILFITWGIVLAGNHTAGVKGISGHTWIFLILSGAATGLSWLFYFKALQVGDVSRVAHYGWQYCNVNKVEKYEDIDHRRRTKSFG